MRIRVVFILPSYAGGGAQRVLLTLLSGLDRDIFEPVLIVLKDEGPLVDLCPAEVTTVVIGRHRARTAAVALLGVLRRLKPAVVFSTFSHINVLILLMRPALFGCPRIVVREPNTPSESLPRQAYGRLLSLGYRVLYRHADRVICPSDRIAKEIEEVFSVPSRRVVRLCNPVDIITVRSRIAGPIETSNNGYTFVGAGQLIPQKGFERLISLFAQMPENTTLIILGEGPMDRELKRLIEGLRLNSRVQLLGFQSCPWPFYARADAFLLPSRWEGMPNVALEALACGTPVIATPESGGIEELKDKAVKGAVSIASFEQDFLHAMIECTARPRMALPRPSLLPNEYCMSHVLNRFSDILTIP
tara:strand:- start:278 stop:1357 length:1080 start_codon:yes stop_codon:yes gene_type:complete